MSAGSPPANGTGEPTMSTRCRTGSARLTSSITVAVVAAPATPVAPGGATLATRAACASARPLVSVSGCGAGATLRGEGDESPQGRATHTHGGSPHHQRHLFSTAELCADAPPAGAFR